MTQPTIHGLTIRKSAKPVNARMVEIPLSHAEAHHFPKGTKVIIALESDSTIQIQAKVWGEKRRYVTILRKQENSNRFLIGTDVMVTPEVVKRVCVKCSHASTPGGRQCFTMTRRLKELVTDAGNPFTPEFVIPALDRIADECKRYKEV